MSTTTTAPSQSKTQEIEAPRDFFSMHELGTFLHLEKERALATNEEIPTADLHRLTTPDWTKPGPQGLLVMFVRKTDTKEEDVSTPIGRKIVRIVDKHLNPVLSHFIGATCGPFSFETHGKIPQGMKMVLLGAA